MPFLCAPAIPQLTESERRTPNAKRNFQMNPRGHVWRLGSEHNRYCSIVERDCIALCFGLCVFVDADLFKPMPICDVDVGNTLQYTYMQCISICIAWGLYQY